MMKKLIKRIITIILMLSTLASPCTYAMAHINHNSDETVHLASHTSGDFAGVTGANILSKIKGAYIPMFDSNAILNAKYDNYWHDYVSAVGGKTNSGSNESYVKHLYRGQTYGSTAGAEYYTGFGSDIAKIVFGGSDGSEVTYSRKAGGSVYREYRFEKDAVASGNGINIHGFIFKNTDDINDDFKYLFITHDTPTTTYHIEFRYAATEEDVLSLSSGPCKQWMAAGLSVDALNEEEDITVRKAIAQTVFDTLSDTKEARDQRSILTGIWDYNFTNAEQGVSSLDNAKKLFKNYIDGTGKEFRDSFGNGTYEEVTNYRYRVYIAESSDSVITGTYLKYILGKGMSISSFSINIDANGTRIVSFDTLGESDSSYTFRKTLVPKRVSIKKVKIKGKKIKISWKPVSDADSYQIVLSAKKNLTNPVATKTTNKTSISIKVRKKKTYYIAVRGYVKDALGEITCGAFSSVKKVKVGR